LRLDSITAVLEAAEVLAPPERELLRPWQIACADMVVPDRVDLIDEPA
jgi:G3E family GTPase